MGKNLVFCEKKEIALNETELEKLGKIKTFHDKWTDVFMRHVPEATTEGVRDDYWDVLNYC